MPRFRRRNGLAAVSPNSLQGAGARVKRDEEAQRRRVNLPWQDRAMEYYKLGGPAWYCAQFYARMLGPLVLYAAKKNPDGEIVPDDDPRAKEQLDRIQDPGGGGRTNLLKTYGRLMFLIGESGLFVSIDADTELEQWEMLSKYELKDEDTQYVRYSGPNLRGKPYKKIPDDEYRELQPGEGVLYRLWARDPQYSAEPDAPMRAALDDLEELLMLTRAVRSRARSRFAGTGGILFIDEKISPRPPEPAPGEDPVEDKYLMAIAQGLIDPIANEGAASEIVPVISRVPVPDTKSIRDMVYHLQIVDAAHVYPEQGMRVECLERIGVDLDMPPEALTGTGEVNHWGAWMIDETTWKGHGQGIAQQLVDDLTQSFYRPALKELGVPGWEDKMIAYDAAEVVNRPDRTKDAKDLHAAGELGGEALRDSAGFTEKDKPSAEERQIWLGVHARDPEFSLTGVSGRLTPASGQDVPTGDGGDEGKSPASAPKGPPAGDQGDQGKPPNPEDSEKTAAGNGQLHTHLVLGGAGVALLRAREAAGNRLRSLAKRDDDLMRMIEDVRAPEVAVVLGRENVRGRLKVTSELELVSCTHDLIVAAMRGWGIHDRELADSIVQNVETYAARTLYRADAVTIPPSLANFITSLLTGEKEKT